MHTRPIQSPAQLKDPNGDAMVDNFRPVQPLNGRSLVVTSEKLAESGGGGMMLNSVSTATSTSTSGPYDVYDKERIILWGMTGSELDHLSFVLTLILVLGVTLLNLDPLLLMTRLMLEWISNRRKMASCIEKVIVAIIIALIISWLILLCIALWYYVAALRQQRALTGRAYWP